MQPGASGRSVEKTQHFSKPEAKRRKAREEIMDRYRATKSPSARRINAAGPLRSSGDHIVIESHNPVVSSRMDNNLLAAPAVTQTAGGL
ncbi:hypothetical protein PROFUN_05427 [Planoprotostelium fungivorum]|uniref:Uncharacterized protein n=1 Tax=Planoprotostelium fungivorum TaxID=1890364 RepID=A0A2P6NQP1_9EUKA|nr:hypothetical protein PROFUN_05427 [Planoprotostelium fungivorum]